MAKKEWCLVQSKLHLQETGILKLPHEPITPQAET